MILHIPQTSDKKIDNHKIMFLTEPGYYLACTQTEDYLSQTSHNQNQPPSRTG